MARSGNPRILMLCCTVALLMIFGSGCGRKPGEVVIYDLPKSESGLDNLPTPPPFLQQIVSGGNAPVDRGERIPARVIVGVADLSGTIWFFKVLGPEDRVSQCEPGVREFLASLRFADGTPQWDLPEGWSVSADSGDRFANIEMNGNNPPLIMAVTSFQMSFDQLLNANRWRGQVGLPPLDRLKSPMETIQANEQEILLFDDVGTMAAPAGSGPSGNGSSASGTVENDTPAVESQPTPPPTDSPAAPGNATAVPKISFVAPTGWEKEESTMAFIRARFARQEDGLEAKITVSRMSLQNGWEDVVAQWSGQAGIAPLSEEDADQRTDAVTISGIDGKKIRILEKEGDDSAAVVGAMINLGSENWFFKLHGDRKIVEKYEDQFAEFLDEFEFSD